MKKDRNKKIIERTKLVLVTGVSAAGKTGLVEHCTTAHPHDFVKFRTTTTREKRKNEKRGQHYHNRMLRSFQRMIEEQRFCEWEEVFPGRFYGFEKKELKLLVKSKKVIITAVDVKGALKFIGKKPSTEKSFIDLRYVDPIVFFVKVPKKELIRRIKEDYEKGNREGGEKGLKERIAQMNFELRQQKHFKNILTNGKGKFGLAANELVNRILHPNKS